MARKQEHTIEIDAPIDAVWKALTDAEELTRWFAEDCKVTPGEGGSIWVSWGEGQSGEKRIDVWEPGKRLRLSAAASEMGPEMLASLTEPIVDEYTLESRGNRTVLRLVYSGVPDSSDWDGYYDGTNRGWRMFFCGLRHYLERHPGERRQTIMIMHPIALSLEQGWQKLIGSEGLDTKGALANAAEGARYSTSTSWGETLDGEVIINLPLKTLCITIENLDDALLSVTFEDMQGTTYVYSSLAVFGMDPARVDEIRKRWGAALEGLFR